MNFWRSTYCSIWHVPLEGGEALDLSNFKDKVQDKLVEKAEEVKDNLEHKLEVDERRVESDKKQLEAVDNFIENNSDQNPDDSSDEVTESNS